MSGLDWSAGFEDLAVGDGCATAWRLVTEHDVQGFAQLTGDRHPLHVDTAWAASHQFGGTVAHGLLVLSLALGATPLDPERVIAMRRVCDSVFKRPVRPGARIRTRCSVDALKPVDDAQGLVTLALVIEQHPGQTVAKAKVELLWACERRLAPFARDAGEFVAIPL